jgi:hypothetical protein
VSYLRKLQQIACHQNEWLHSELQQKLNDATNGLIWTEGATKEGRQISWLRCIYMEAAEAIDR